MSNLQYKNGNLQTWQTLGKLKSNKTETHRFKGDFCQVSEWTFVVCLLPADCALHSQKGFEVPARFLMSF